MFILGHWCLLFDPEHVLTVCPTLWKPAARAPDAVMLPVPKTRVQVFDFGEQVQRFNEHCKESKEDKLDAECQSILKKAAQILGAERPLTVKQLLGERDLLAELDQQRSVMDRVAGFFSFVNILWLMGITGIVCTVGPCIGVLIGPVLKDYAQALYDKVLRPAGIFLHEMGVWEVLAYVLCALYSQSAKKFLAGISNNRDLKLDISMRSLMSKYVCFSKPHF